MVVDLHSDLLADLEHRRVRGERDSFRRHHLPSLQAAGIRVQVLAVFVESAFVPDGALRRALRLIETAMVEEEESDGALRLVRSRSELDEALRGDAVAGILSLEGAEPLGRDPQLLRVFARLGVRLVGPTWNRANDFADGAGEDRGVGITALGERLLDELQEGGLGLDLSHLSPRAVERAFERFGGTLLASHSNSASVYGNARNAPDDLLAEIGRRGGVCGLNALRVFIGPGEATARLADHAEAIARLGGPATPAFGCDFTSFLPAGLAEAPELGLPPGTDRSLAQLELVPRETVYAAVGQELRSRGWSDEQVDGLLHQNALRVLREILV